LFAQEGVDDILRSAFLVYLVSHSRPMHEVLTARRKDMTAEFDRGFDGMTEELVTLAGFVAAREDLIANIVGNMPDKHWKFLISFEKGKPDWPLIGLPAAANLPAVKWRQVNLNKLLRQTCSSGGSPRKSSL
jgi:hypothetical protein